MISEREKNRLKRADGADRSPEQRARPKKKALEALLMSGVGGEVINFPIE